MIQLAFEPALDPFNTMFRLLRLRETIRKADRLQRDHVRVMDFFLVFPFRISIMRMKQPHRRFRALAVKYTSKRPYGEVPEDKLLFERMSPFQEAAFQSLTTSGFFDGEQFDHGWIRPTMAELPAAVRSRVMALNKAEADLIDFMDVLATEYEVSGPDGLKDRTGLLEHRYDAL